MTWEALAPPLTELDRRFGHLLTRLAGEADPALQLAAMLASHWTGNGHVCVNLPAVAGRPLFETDGPVTPALNDWLATLRASPVVGQPGQFRPLILDRRGRLYLYRYWAYERQLADALLARAEAAALPLDEKRLRTDLARLFPAKSENGPTDWQKIAAATASLKRLCVITGGPGAGKTTTVVRLLALLISQTGSARPPRIGLAAPTGKAAARLQEAIRLAKNQLDLDCDRLAAIPDTASTVHRLLGAQRHSVYFRHGRDNPLPLDVVVVDEASMVDLALMAKLVAALPATARLILLGDKDQLASVEAGAVLGDVCAGAVGFSEDWRQRLQALTGEAIPPCGGPPAAALLSDAIVLLQHSYRFGADSGIGRLAQAVRQGAGAAALDLLENAEGADLAWRPLAAAGELALLAGRIEQGYRPYLDRLRAGAPIAEIFAAFNQFRLLCAHRGGPFGVENVNRMCEQRLRASGWIRSRQSWYPGRPVMITRNDYNLRLFNGDIGIALPEAGSELRVFFQTSEGTLRSFAPGRLPAHETVFAMTVHKSQGSEFTEVVLVLPVEASAVMTRELIYTGLTRAKVRVEIWAGPESFAVAVAQPSRRSSGLREALWGV